MLSDKTKLKRINERLEKMNLKLVFQCMDLKTYTPSLKILDVKRNNGVMYPYMIDNVEVYVKVTNVQGLVVFTVEQINTRRLFKANQFKDFLKNLNKLNDILDYCNNLGMVVPPYEK